MRFLSDRHTSPCSASDQRSSQPLRVYLAYVVIARITDIDIAHTVHGDGARPAEADQTALSIGMASCAGNTGKCTEVAMRGYFADGVIAVGNIDIVVMMNADGRRAV